MRDDEQLRCISFVQDIHEYMHVEEKLLARMRFAPIMVNATCAERRHIIGELLQWAGKRYMIRDLNDIIGALCPDNWTGSFGNYSDRNTNVYVFIDIVRHGSEIAMLFLNCRKHLNGKGWSIPMDRLQYKVDVFDRSRLVE